MIKIILVFFNDKHQENMFAMKKLSAIKGKKIYLNPKGSYLAKRKISKMVDIHERASLHCKSS